MGTASDMMETLFSFCFPFLCPVLDATMDFEQKQHVRYAYLPVAQVRLVGVHYRYFFIAKQISIQNNVMKTSGIATHKWRPLP